MPKSDAAMLARFLSNEFPVLPRGYPSKPSPIHIANNFIARALGTGAAHKSFSQFLVTGESGDGVWAGNPPVDNEQSRVLFKTIFDSDGNVFEKFSSPFPVTADFAGPDSSDDGYAFALWSCLGNENRSRLQAALVELTDISDPATLDVASRLASTLRNSLPRADVRAVATQDLGESEFGRRVGSALCIGLEAQLRDHGRGMRLEIIRQFAIMLSFSVVLGMLYDTCASSTPRDDGTAPDPAEILGILCFTGLTPGGPGDPLVRLSTASLQDALQRSRAGLVRAVEARFNQRLPGVRGWAETAEALAVQYLSGSEARKLAARLQNYERKPKAKDIVEEWMPMSHLRLAVRSLGYKAGCVVPQRSGPPRFALETAFMTPLVSYLTPSGGIPLQEFIDHVYATFGLLIGAPSFIEGTALDRLNWSAGQVFDAEELLLDAGERLTDRLLRAGLARQYSDGFVVVGNR